MVSHSGLITVMTRAVRKAAPRLRRDFGGREMFTGALLGVGGIDRPSSDGGTPEEIVAKLRQVDVLVSQGQSVAGAVRSIGVTQFTYYRWRKEFGGLKSDQVKRLKDLEKENERLRKAVSDLTLEKLILREAASGNY